MALCRMFIQKRLTAWGRRLWDEGSRMQVQTIVWCMAMVVLCTGCVGVRTEGEKPARQNLQAIEKLYRPGGQRPVLSVLTADSPLSDFLLFSTLNQPQIEAAYYDWAAAVQRITVERSFRTQG